MLRALREGASAARGMVESAGAHAAMRRLTSREYENTLATLFGRRVDTLGLTADFPKEKTSDHIDTIGQTLVTSGFLLDQYFQSANRLVETRLGKPVMKPQAVAFQRPLRPIRGTARPAQGGLQLRLPQPLRATQYRHPPGWLWPH